MRVSTSLNLCADMYIRGLISIAQGLVGRHILHIVIIDLPLVPLTMYIPCKKYKCVVT